MQPTVNLEARPTESIGLRLTSDLLAAIDCLAERQNATRSAVARAAMRAGLRQLQQELA